MEDWVVRSFEAACKWHTGNTYRYHTRRECKIGRFEASKQHLNGILAIHIDSILARNGRLGSSKLRSNI